MAFFRFPLPVFRPRCLFPPGSVPLLTPPLLRFAPACSCRRFVSVFPRLRCRSLFALPLFFGRFGRALWWGSSLRLVGLWSLWGPPRVSCGALSRPCVCPPTPWLIHLAPVGWLLYCITDRKQGQGPTDTLAGPPKEVGLSRGLAWDLARVKMRWRLAVGGRRLAVGGWRLTVGGYKQLAVGSWR